jgi:hypothetical protein
MQIGMLGALNHLIIPSEKLWGASNKPALTPLLEVFRFLYEEPAPPISVHETFQYLEVNLAGTVSLPGGLETTTLQTNQYIT